MEFYNVLLPNALQKKKEKEEDAIEKSLSTLSKGVAEEELADLVVEGKGEYKEIQSSYLGIFKTIGGNLIEEAWKNSDSDLSFDEWNDIQANIDSSLEPLKKLTLNDYEDLAKVWDRIGAYDPDELKKALGDLGLDQGIIELIAEFYKDSFDYSRELAHKQIVKSKVGNTSKLQDLTNTFGKLQAPAELMNDINDTVQAADALYSQGYTARA